MKYTIKVTAWMRMYTAYHGDSYAAACKAVDNAKALIVLVNGTAVISAQYGGGALYPVWDISEGQASAKIPVRAPVIFTEVSA